MKKLFTFLMAMMVISVFAQSNKYEVVGVPADQNVDRSGYHGYYVSDSYVHVEQPESEYFLFIPAGTFETEVTLEKVRFYTIPSENISNYTESPFDLDNDFEIRIYTGSSVDGLNFLPGTRVYTQVYNPQEAGSDAGVQNVRLTTPFTVSTTDNIAIGIFNPEKCAMGLCEDDASCANVNFALWPEYDSDGIHHYYWTGSNPAWAFENATVREHDPWNLSVFYNDGQAYTRECDWQVRFYDAEEEGTSKPTIDHIVISQYTDSLRVCYGMYNGDLDTCIGDPYYSLWLEISGENVLIADSIALGPEEYLYDTLEPGYGWRIGSEAPGIPVFDIASNYDEIEWPINICLEVYPNPLAPDYIDPRPENNKLCIPVGREEDFVGVKENNNTLNVNPNPASTTLTVENAAGSQIFVYNIAGQEVMSVKSAKANETLNVSNLNAGLYIVRVVNGSEVSTAKVSIVR
jgi:hypothetical protein